MAHGNNLACQQMCHVIQMVTMPVVVTVPIISGEQQPPLIFSLKKQGPHRKWQRGNRQWTNNNNMWCIWTMDKVEVSTITPPALLLFHTRNRSHVAVGDVATHNGQQKWTNNHNDKWTWQWLQMKDNGDDNKCHHCRHWSRWVIPVPLLLLTWKQGHVAMSTNNSWTMTDDNKRRYNV